MLPSPFPVATIDQDVGEDGVTDPRLIVPLDRQIGKALGFAVVGVRIIFWKEERRP